ncbi:Recombinase family protein [Candidatus Hepatincolaceae symbiont of Richtersius coronifer]
MSGQLIGYIRVSTIEQTTERQLEGVGLDRSFIDKVSGKSLNRPELERLLNYAREGDTIIVHSIDRLARNLGDLRKLIDNLTKKGIKVQFVKENLTFSGNDNPISILLLNVLGAVAEFERAIIKERQMEGIAIAKKKGKYLGGTKSLSLEETKKLLQKLNTKFYKNKSELAKEFNISRASLYNYEKKYSDLDTKNKDDQKISST